MILEIILSSFSLLISVESSTVDSIKHYVCIDSVAHSEFVVDKKNGCFPLNVQATNTSKSLNSCDPEFLWEVNFLSSICNSSGSWSFDGLSNSSSIDADFVFNSPDFMK